MAAVHIAAFPDSALTFLGQETVRRYYDWQLNGPHEVTALGVFSNRQSSARPPGRSFAGQSSANDLIGFCIGGRFQGSLSGFLRKNRLYLLWQTASHFWLLAKPVFRERAGDGIRMMGKHLSRRRVSPPPIREPITLQSGQYSARQYPASSPARSFGILSIAVHPSCQGQGIGRFLMGEAEKVARKCGYAEMNLTVEPHNNYAIRFYESLGWIKILAGSSPGVPANQVGMPGNGVWNGKMKKVL